MELLFFIVILTTAMIHHRKWIYLFVFVFSLLCLALFIRKPQEVRAGCRDVFKQGTCYAKAKDGFARVPYPCIIKTQYCSKDEDPTPVPPTPIPPTAVPQNIPNPACTAHPFMSGAIGTTQLTSGQPFQMRCNYGVKLNCIDAPIVNSGCTFSGWENTTAVFNCTAPTAPGGLIATCSLFTGTSNKCCARSDIVGSYVVKAAPQYCDINQACPVGKDCYQPPSDCPPGKVCTLAIPRAYCAPTVCSPACSAGYTCKNTNQCPPGAYCAMALLSPVCVPNPVVCSPACAAGQTCLSSPAQSPHCVGNTPVPTAAVLCSKRPQGDANCDNIIDQKDIDVFIGVMRGNGYLTTAYSADFNNDSKVNMVDYEILRKTLYE